MLDDVVAKVKEVADRAARASIALIEYALSYEPIAGASQKEIEAEVAKLGSDDYDVRAVATERLARSGPVAFAVLQKARTDDAEVRYRVAAVLDRLRPLHEEVSRRGMDHDVEFLLELTRGENAALRDRAWKRLQQILPSGVSASEWKESRARYRWDAASQKFIP